ncbi:glycosyltransferase [Limnoglobus roseus]|uniref:GT4 family glycosyltransferase n=1 Tax=Limnoglobus roseus TaxID=2598579 RepID=A0A5C1AN84_9BACT|nr:glycosyltransferase [Limnoglobus roseus]QEL18378.1 GT4 family glycosyltransferase [Limnoglobus roseus]
MTRPDLTLIVTAHAEGRLAHRTVRSAVAAVDLARRQGRIVECIAVLDRPTPETRDYFTRDAPADWRLLDGDHGDLGLARNQGVEAAGGRWVAFLDADDLLGSWWLLSVLEQPDADPRTVYVPEATITFEAHHLIHWLTPSDAPAFRPEVLVATNYWMALVAARRELLCEIPFAAARGGSGFGFEDWHWFTQVLAAGGAIQTVPGTTIFIRRKSRGSLLREHQIANALLQPTDFLAPTRYRVADTRPVVDRPRAAASGRWDSLRSRAGRFGLAVARRFPILEAPLARAYRSAVRLNARFGPGAELPSWLVDQCRELHAVEPQLFPDDLFRIRLRENCIPNPPVGRVYGKLCEAVTGPVRLAFIVPWLRTGGSDLETLNYVRLAAERVADGGVLVLATEPVPSPWASRLPAGARFVDLAALACELRDDEREYVLGTFLVQLGADAVHVVNSTLGFAVVERYGKAVAQRSRVFASVFCEDVTADGRRTGFALDQVPAVADHLAGVFADNRRILELMIQMFALNPNRLHTHYQPVDLPPAGRQDRPPGGKLQVLWAGRLDRQKRPDLLIEVARRVTHLPVHFHAYGASVLRSDAARVRLRGLPNLTYHGPFDGFESLPVGDFDLFLNTSQWEGMPNVLLEALAAGLPVMSSDAGGIPELIRDGETGLLVSPFDAVDAYISKFERACYEPDLLPKLLAAGRSLLAARHTWDHFRQAVGAVPGYLPAASADGS